MQMLKMSGFPITNMHDYRKYFNIYDILKHNKEFNIFALSHFANLSKTFSYCAAMVYSTIANQVPIFMRDSMHDIASEFDFKRCNSENFWENPFAFCRSCSPSLRQLSISNEIAKQFTYKISDIIFKKVMIITVAAFVFLNKSCAETKIDLERAKNNFLGKDDSNQKNAFEVHFEDNMSECIQTITLDPSSQVYTCVPFDNADFAKIKTFRIEASRNIITLASRAVKIRIAEEQIIIPAGEHVYVNIIHGQVATILGKRQLKKNYELQNTGVEKDALSFNSENRAIHDFYGNEYISSFDFSARDNSIIYLNNMKLCLDMCLSPALKGQMAEYTDIPFVEVKLMDSRFYLLRSNGELLSNDPKCNEVKNVYSIDSILRRYQV